MQTFFALLLFAALATPTAADARIPRSSAAVAEFKRANPCPVNLATRGSCPGWQVDHVQPLCSGGADSPPNMQWLTVQQHREKTRLDVIACRRRG